MENKQDDGTPALAWFSALIDENQFTAWVTMARLYAAMYRELIAGGVPDEVALVLV